MQQSEHAVSRDPRIDGSCGGVNEGFFGELIHPNHMGHRLMASELLKLMDQRKLSVMILRKESYLGSS